MTRDEQSARDKAALTVADKSRIAAALNRRDRKRNGRDRHIEGRRIARDAERVRLAGVLAAYRRVEWNEHRMLVQRITDGSPVWIPTPDYRKHAGPSPLVEPPPIVARVRPRGTYTAELVRATTRGHDYVPRRPT